MKFHRMERLHVVAIAAGLVHSVALTEDGALFYWASSDPAHKCHQVFSIKPKIFDIFYVSHEVLIFCCPICFSCIHCVEQM